MDSRGHARDRAPGRKDRAKTPLPRGLDRLDELVADFAGAPEQIGFHFHELYRQGRLDAVGVEEAYIRVAALAGRAFAEQAFGLDRLLAGSAAELASEIRADVDTERDRQRAAQTDLLVDALAEPLGLARDAVVVRADREAARRTGGRGARGLMDDGVVYLDPDAYDPQTAEGRTLLAHEVVHLAQARLDGGDPTDRGAAEGEAATLATRFATGGGITRPHEALGGCRAAADRDADDDELRRRQRATLGRRLLESEPDAGALAEVRGQLLRDTLEAQVLQLAVAANRIAEDARTLSVEAARFREMHHHGDGSVMQTSWIGRGARAASQAFGGFGTDDMTAHVEAFEFVYQYHTQTNIVLGYYAGAIAATPNDEANVEEVSRLFAEATAVFDSRVVGPDGSEYQAYQELVADYFQRSGGDYGRRAAVGELVATTVFEVAVSIECAMAGQWVAGLEKVASTWAVMRRIQAAVLAFRAAGGTARTIALGTAAGAAFGGAAQLVQQTIQYGVVEALLGRPDRIFTGVLHGAIDGLLGAAGTLLKVGAKGGELAKESVQQFGVIFSKLAEHLRQGMQSLRFLKPPGMEATVRLMGRGGQAAAGSKAFGVVVEKLGQALTEGFIGGCDAVAKRISDLTRESVLRAGMFDNAELRTEFMTGFIASGSVDLVLDAAATAWRAIRGKGGADALAEAAEGGGSASPHGTVDEGPSSPETVAPDRGAAATPDPASDAPAKGLAPTADSIGAVAGGGAAKGLRNLGGPFKEWIEDLLEKLGQNLDTAGRKVSENAVARTVGEGSSDADGAQEGSAAQIRSVYELAIASTFMASGRPTLEDFAALAEEARRDLGVEAPLDAAETRAVYDGVVVLWDGLAPSKEGAAAPDAAQIGGRNPASPQAYLDAGPEGTAEAIGELLRRGPDADCWSDRYTAAEEIGRALRAWQRQGALRSVLVWLDLEALLGAELPAVSQVLAAGAEAEGFWFEFTAAYTDADRFARIGGRWLVLYDSYRDPCDLIENERLEYQGCIPDDDGIYWEAAAVPVYHAVEMVLESYCVIARYRNPEWALADANGARIRLGIPKESSPR